VWLPIAAATMVFPQPSPPRFSRVLAARCSLKTSRHGAFRWENTNPGRLWSFLRSSRTACGPGHSDSPVPSDLRMVNPVTMSHHLLQPSDHPTGLGAYVRGAGCHSFAVVWFKLGARARRRRYAVHQSDLFCCAGVLLRGAQIEVAGLSALSFAS
jgi:hypothetical protein